jgi:hypothetical protein
MIEIQKFSTSNVLDKGIGATQGTEAVTLRIHILQMILVWKEQGVGKLLSKPYCHSVI